MFEDFNQKIRSLFGSYLDTLRSKVIGRNNERLDFAIDSFYKLKEQQKNMIIAGFSVFLGVLVILAGLFYFSKTNELDSDLNQKLIALREFRSGSVRYKSTNKKYTKLVGLIERKISDLRLKSFFEKTMKENKIEFRGLDTIPIDSEQTNPIYDNIKEYNVEVRVSKISIPKIMDFIIKVEKSSYLIKVKDLKITGLYGNKLFFDLDVVFRAFQNT